MWCLLQNSSYCSCDGLWFSNHGKTFFKVTLGHIKRNKEKDIIDYGTLKRNISFKYISVNALIFSPLSFSAVWKLNQCLVHAVL